MANTTRRRDFLLAACPLVPLLAACETDKVKSNGAAEIFDIGTEPALASVGGSAKKTFGANNNGRPVLITRISENMFSVLTTVCTHMGCEVGLPAAGQPIICPCHGSNYNSANGRVVKGLAPAPLKKFASIYDSKINTLKIMF